MCCTALIKAVSDRCHHIMMFGCLGGRMGGGESSGGGGWGRKDHPHGSLCNNDSNVNDGAATSINSGLLQELQRRPAGGFTLQSADLGHVGVSQPGIRGGRTPGKQTTTHSQHAQPRLSPPAVDASTAAPHGAFSAARLACPSTLCGVIRQHHFWNF